MLNFNTKCNIAHTYMAQSYPLNHIFPEKFFGYAQGETVEESAGPKHKMNEKQLSDLYDRTDQDIIKRIAMSKYLLPDQLHQYLWLSGRRISTGDVCRRLRKLMMTRTIRQVQVTDGENGLKKLDCYKLDYWGNKYIYSHGMYLHTGVKYLPYKSAVDQDKLDGPVEVKKVLIANQLLLNMLKNHIDVCRFGFMDTLRPVSEIYDTYEEVTAPMLRTHLNVTINPFFTGGGSCNTPVLLSYEVVRCNPEALDHLANKIKRFEAFENRELYPCVNYHPYAGSMHFVICGESEAHNREVYDYLKKAEGIDSDLRILFTDDLLVQKGDTALYEFTKEGNAVYYQLPSYTMPEQYAA
ncbi:MAG: hypothetical protein E7253_03570 [Lachnospiraceae bacterium]|nr:hypothetical protein [Lachnospiraceae bacterium]